MANEFNVDGKAYVVDVKDFQNGGCVVKVANTPSYKDKNTGQYVDKPTLYFDVHPLSNDAKDAIDMIRQYKSQGLSVKVLVRGTLSKRISQKDGKTYENLDIAADTIALLSAKPKKGASPNGALPPQQYQPQDGFSNQNPFGDAQPVQGVQQYPQQQPTEPWAQRYNDGGFV
ncbi:hypothetical protein [Bifidobacterium sp. SO1]|uniref:hypothetical protein n=1 Tax=Bifidobacterium sp. SO1 TaxID=2809029 RepID=UPI001BDD49D3|nr:hypothetical protein [Bifidobacterium sp. SO1]MBT1161272.1 hypothetical protein [Bifidobacterium sp. SO1]